MNDEPSLELDRDQQAPQTPQQASDAIEWPDIPTHDLATAEQFLSQLDHDADKFTFVLLPDRANGSRPITKRCALTEMWPLILKLNSLELGYGVFVAINETDGKGRKTENIVRARVLVADADSPEGVAGAEAVISETALEPSVRICSSLGKKHFYWLIDDLALDQFSPWQKALAARLGTDGSVCDLPRVMRLPGTLHLKSEPQPVTLQVGDPCQIYQIQMLVDGFKLDSGAHGRRKPTSALLDNEPLDALDDLGGGIDRGWFDKLPDLAKDEALRQMLDVLPDIALGGREEWRNCLMAAHASRSPHAEEIARKWSKLGGDKYSDAEFDKAWDSFTDKPGGISIGTLIKLATERGFGASAWSIYVDGRQRAAALLNSPHAPLVGGKPLLTTLPPQTLRDLPRNRARIMEALDRRLAADPYTFQNGDQIVCLRMLDPSTLPPGVTDAGNMPTILPITSADVAYIADRDDWRGYSSGRVAKGEEPKLRPIHVPKEVCKDYLDMARVKIGVRRLNGLARVPIINDAGDLDFTEGYHEATGVFRDRTPVLDVPDNPTRDDCVPAVETLMKPFWEYKFPDRKLGRILVLTMILTALERPFIRTAPMFLINGSMAGTGKGLLVRAITRLAFDTTPRFMNYGFDAEEFDKRIAAMLFTPAPCLIIDNANGKRISNDTLETAITEGMVDIRPLGQTARVSIVNRSMIVTTGNGVELSGDMTRRALGIEIEPKSSSPETEVYPYTPDEYVAERRDELLTAAFTLMRAYRRAGMLKLAKTSAGSFPEWERRVRDLVMWLFKVDAAQQFVRNRDNASDKRAHAALLHALHGVFTNHPFAAGSYAEKSVTV